LDAYSYETDFEDLTVGSSYADQSAVNKSFSSSPYRTLGNIGGVIASVDGSKVVAAGGYNNSLINFYNVFVRLSYRGRYRKKLYDHGEGEG